MGRIERSNKDRPKNGRRTCRNPILAYMGFESWERGAHLEDAEVQELLREPVPQIRTGV